MDLRRNGGQESQALRSRNRSGERQGRRYRRGKHRRRGQRDEVGLCASRERRIAPIPQTKRILVVEDERAMTAGMEQALKESGYLVSVATNGRQALALAESHDLILADVMMPAMNGFDMVREL